MMKSACGLLLAAVFLAGCGGNNDAAKQEMEAKFLKLDRSTAGMETMNAGSTSNLETATRQYIALVHKYDDLLGRSGARERLRAKGDELGPYCLQCRATLYGEAQRY